MPDSPDWTFADGARDIIASCATFISETGSASVSGAKTHVDILESEPQESGPSYERPFALVLIPNTSYNIRYPYYPEGSIKVILEIDIPVGLTKEDELKLAANFFGNIKAELSLLASTWHQALPDSSLRISKIEQSGPYLRSRDTEQFNEGTNGFWQSTLILSLGD